MYLQAMSNFMEFIFVSIVNLTWLEISHYILNYNVEVLPTYVMNMNLDTSEQYST